MYAKLGNFPSALFKMKTLYAQTRGIIAKNKSNSNSKRHQTSPAPLHNTTRDKPFCQVSPLSLLSPLPNNLPPPNLSLNILKSPLPLSPALPTPDKPNVIPALQHARCAHSQL